MRWWIYGVVLMLAACASQPKADRARAYADYWHCARNAAGGYIDTRALSAREAAMRAQAHCYDFYRRYKTANEVYLRSVVRPSGYDMATQLADQAALQKKSATSDRLTALVLRAR